MTISFLDIERLHEKFKSKGKYQNPHNLVFCTTEGKPYDPRTFEEEFKEILQAAKVKDINLHATRHTFATEAMQKTTDIVTVAEILGHAKPSTTLDMYGHTFDDRKKALMAQFK